MSQVSDVVGAQQTSAFAVVTCAAAVPPSAHAPSPSAADLRSGRGGQTPPDGGHEAVELAETVVDDLADDLRIHVRVALDEHVAKPRHALQAFGQRRLDPAVPREQTWTSRAMAASRADSMSTGRPSKVAGGSLSRRTATSTSLSARAAPRATLPKR